MIWTLDEVLVECEVARGSLVLEFRERGRVAPRSLVLATRHIKTGRPDKSLVVCMPTQLANQNEKRRYGEGLRRTARMTCAEGVITGMEMWMLAPTIPEDLADTAADERAVELSRRWAGKLEHAPGRKEVLYVSCEHESFGGVMRAWMTEIHRHGGVAIVDDKWHEMNGTGDGNFMNMLRGN